MWESSSHPLHGDWHPAERSESADEIAAVLRILYVDDYSLDRALVRDALELEHGGFIVSEAASQEEFQQLLASGEFDLVLSDFNILGFEGLQVIDAVKAKDPNLPVIIVTGTGSEEVAAAAMKRGAADYIIKTPDRIRRLPLAIRSAIETVQLRRAREQAWQALVRSEREKALVLDATAETFVVYDTGLRIQWANRAAQRALGDESGQKIGLHCCQAWQQRPAPCRHCHLDLVLETGRPQDAYLNTRDGRTWFVRGYPLVDQAGRIDGLIEFGQDITERVQMEEALRQSKRLLEKTFASLDDAVLIVDDASGEIIDCNPAASRIFGYPVGEMIGRSTGFLHLDEQQRTAFERALERAIRQQVRLFLADHELRRQDGSTFFSELSVVRLDGEHGQRAVRVDVVRDITERRMAREALNRQRNTLQHLSNQLISAQEDERRRLSQELHDELGQSLTAISINLAEIKHNLPAGSGSAVEERLVETTWLADQTLEQVREMALNLRPAMLDDLGLAATLRWYLRRFARRLNIAAELAVSGTQERLGPGVETALYRAAQEALTNVARHANAGRVQVTLDVGDTAVSLQIKDDGCGFEPAAARSGQGIGLTGMRERLAPLGGQLEITSAPGSGTQLLARLPLNADSTLSQEAPTS